MTANARDSKVACYHFCANYEAIHTEKHGLQKVRLLFEIIFNLVNVLLADGVVSAGIVVGGVLLAGDQLFGMVELTVRSCTDLV